MPAAGAERVPAAICGDRPQTVTPGGEATGMAVREAGFGVASGREGFDGFR
ncbi:MAG: hypothetical protein ACU0BS_08495 [Hasllibacter sp.]